MACTNHPTVNEGIVRCTRCHRQFCPDCVVYLRSFAYCGSCKGEQVRDIQSGRTTALDLASIWQRFAALFIDGLVVNSVLCLFVFPLAIGMGVLGAATKIDENLAGVAIQVLTMPFVFLIPFVYEGLMLKARGQTLGKMALGLKVVTPEGRDITPAQAWKRSGAKAAFNMCCALIDLLPAAFDEPEKRTLHDRAAETRVVRLRP